jgi:hypothetical protein
MTDLLILVITVGVVITLAGYLVLCDRVRS